MTQQKKPHYEGKKDKYQPPIVGAKDPKGRKYFPYLPSPELREAVNLAIALNRPLLLEGEPGCGKTRLAGAIAYEFTHKYLADQKDEDGNQKWWPYSIWNVKSYGRARDGLYTFDAVGRLRDAQLVGSDPKRLKTYLGEKETEELKQRLDEPARYLKLGALGEALSQNLQNPIVLIDEIDKADSDFPNDLLLELDQLRFEIPETGEEYPKPNLDPQPIIIITSNQERPLPEPFLRRCIYFYVNFPEKDELIKVIASRFGEMESDRLEFVDQVVEHFLEVHDVLKEQPGSKPPGTSEILDFLEALKDYSITDATTALENLASVKQSPLLGIVLKTQTDQELYRHEFGNE